MNVHRSVECMYFGAYSAVPAFSVLIRISYSLTPHKLILYGRRLAVLHQKATKLASSGQFPVTWDWEFIVTSNGAILYMHGSEHQLFGCPTLVCERIRFSGAPPQGESGSGLPLPISSISNLCSGPDAVSGSVCTLYKYHKRWAACGCPHEHRLAFVPCAC